MGGAGNVRSGGGWGRFDRTSLKDLATHPSVAALQAELPQFALVPLRLADNECSAADVLRLIQLLTGLCFCGQTSILHIESR